MGHSQACPTEVFWFMLCVGSDEVTAFWQNDSSTFPFYETFSNNIPNWAIFVKEAFWFDD